MIKQPAPLAEVRRLIREADKLLSAEYMRSLGKKRLSAIGDAMDELVHAVASLHRLR
jgi:hypothetical protein